MVIKYIIINVYKNISNIKKDNENKDKKMIKIFMKVIL